jgi:hypothetical protein
MSKISQILSPIRDNILFRDIVDAIDDYTKKATKLLDMFLAVHPNINNAFQNDVAEFIPTKFHNENLYEHSVCTGVFGGCFASVFYNSIANTSLLRISRETFIDICIEAGTLHDIGKPLARITMTGSKTKHLYTGHAQLGTRLIDSIMPARQFKYAIEWAVSHHMCECTHCRMNDFTKNHPCYESMMMDISPDPTMAYISMATLSVLAFADMFARIDEKFDYSVKDTSQYSLDLYAKLNEMYTSIKLKHYSKTIIHMIGLSGSGKSHTSNFLYDTFGDKYDIIVVERDKSLYKAYADLLKKNLQDVFDIPYKEIYQAMAENKGLVQSQWVSDLNDALTIPIVSKQQLIIIDTCQTLYSSAWKNTIDSFDEDATSEYENGIKIGYYTIPVNMLGIFHQNKRLELSSLPINTTSGAFWPHLISEMEKANSSKPLFSYATGSISLLSEWLNKNYGKITTSINPNIQQDLLHNLLNNFAQINAQLNTCEEICTEFCKFLCSTSGGCSNDFDNPFVLFRIEQQSDLYKLVMFTYRDGFQQFNMKTRDYRGEGILYDCTTKHFIMCRPALPVFPEMTSVIADHRVLPYIAGDFHKLFHPTSPNHAIPNAIERKTASRIVLTPKYDGSLFNLTFIGFINPIYLMIMDIINKSVLPSKSYYKTDNGIFIIGSKGTCFAKDPVNTRIHKAILGSYTSVDEFINKISKIVNKYDQTFDCITLHFEAIDVLSTPELTVYYGYSAAPLFGITFYNSFTNEKKFVLPTNIKNIDDTILLTDMFSLNHFSDVVEKFNNSYKELLQGNEKIEPEGFVVHIFDDMAKCWFPIKYKFDIYYVAHKPNTSKNQEKAKQMVNEPQFAAVIKRFMKFREKPTMISLLNQCNYTAQINQFAKSIFSSLNAKYGKTINKGEWAKYWKDDPTRIVPLQQIIDLTAQIVSMHYPEYVEKVSEKAFPLLMNLYMHLEKPTIIQADIDNSINKLFG